MMPSKINSTFCCSAFLIFSGLLAPIASLAAVHCVRAGASGTGTGSDWANAYTTLPTHLTRGDTYYVAAGNYSAHDFNDPDSGSTLITVRAATTSDHGTDTGWNAAYQGQAVFRCASACGAIFYFETDYYVVTGVYRSAATGNAVNDWITGYGFKLDDANGYAGSEAQGGLGYAGTPLYVHDITIQYAELNGAHPTSDSSTLDLQVNFQGGSYNLLFDHLYVHDGYVPFFLKGNHNNDTFGSGQNITIQYTYAAYNYGSSAWHSEGCSCSEGLRNFTIRWTYWVDMVSSGDITTAAGGDGLNAPWYIYGNVFMGKTANHCLTGDGPLAIWSQPFNGGNVYFLNNTIANLSPCGSGYNQGVDIGFGLGDLAMNQLIVQNNLWWNDNSVNIIPTGTTNWDTATLTGTTWSYNAYFQLTDQSYTSDPDPNKQVSSSNPFVNSAQADWRLSANTAPWTPLNSPFNVDINGVTRTSSRGAYQYAPNPPTNLNATAQ